MMANLRLALDIEVKAGDQSHSNHSLPGLMSLLKEKRKNQNLFLVTLILERAGLCEIWKAFLNPVYLN